MALVRPMMKRDHDGIGGWKFRLQSVVVPPTYIQCSNITPGGSFSVALNSAGEAYFGSYKDDVNAAIAAAVSDAVANLLATAGKRCEDECYAVLSNEQHGSSGDAEASAMIVLTQGAPAVPNCWEHEEEVPATGIHITASAPGVAGWDLSGIIGSINASSLPTGTNPEVAATLTALAADLAASSQIGTADELGAINLLLSPNRGIKVDTGTQGVSIFDGDATGSSPTSWTGAGIGATYGTMNFEMDGSISFSDRYVEGATQFSPTASWSNTPPSSSFFPGSFSTSLSDDDSPRTIDQTIPLTNTGGVFDVHTPTGDTASLTASGSMSIAVLPANKKKTEDGYRSRCYYDVTYINVVPMQRLCGPIKFELLTRGAPYKFHHTNPPPCSYNVSPVFAEES